MDNMFHTLILTAFGAISVVFLGLNAPLHWYITVMVALAFGAAVFITMLLIEDRFKPRYGVICGLFVGSTAWFGYQPIALIVFTIVCIAVGYGGWRADNGLPSIGEREYRRNF